MIVKCSNDNIDEMISYIGRDYGKCLYLYIDIKKYGMDTEFFNVWKQIDKNDELLAIVSKYYDGMQVYSKSNHVDEELIEFIYKNTPDMIVGMEEMIAEIGKGRQGYELENGVVAYFDALKVEPDKNAYEADDSEIKEIVDLLSEDEALGKPYGYEKLLKQFIERKKDNFGRSFVLRDEKNDEIICHAGTYAELSDIAVISGVITAPEYRGKGFSKGTLAALCEKLQAEGKDVFSYYYIPAAEKMHIGTGFKKIGNWSKLVKKK